MRVWLISALVLAVVGLIILAIVTRDTPPDLPPIEAVEVEVTSGAVSFAGKIVRPGEIVTANADGQSTRVTVSGTPTAATEATATTPEPPPVITPGLLSIRVVDALGDLIQNARVEVAGTVHAATDGRCAIDGLDEGEQVVTAHAEGFASTQRNVRLPAREIVEITLEYTCSFAITVRDGAQNGEPVPGAEVEVWEGPEVLRPVGHSLTIRRRNTLWDSWDDAIVLRREGGQIRVVGNVGEGRFRFESHPGSPIPRMGDTVTGLTDDFSPVGIPSLLRLWDSLAVLCPPNEDSVRSLSLTLNRNGEAFEGRFYGAGKSKGRQVASAVTDDEGRCTFTALPARLYFATAHKGALRGHIHRLCPVFSRVTIPLFPEGENTIYAKVINEDAPPYGGRKIRDAEVQVQAVDRLVVLSDKTDPRGTVTFGPLPLGDYKITVTPPEEANTTPPQKTVEVRIEEPSNRLLVPFQMRDGYTVTGRVLRADTNQPVAEHPVRLLCERKRLSKDKSKERDEAMRERGRPDWKIWYPYAETESDENGEFAFHPVESKGEYKIESALQAHARPPTFDGFVSASMLYTPPDGTTAKEDPQFWLEDSDVTGLEYYVLPGAMTRFLGEVVSAEEEPVEFARVALDEAEPQHRTSTRKDGSFELTVFQLESGDVTLGHLEAVKLNYEIETKTVVKNGQPMRGSVIGPHSEIQGFVDIEYRPGDTVEEIRIVLEPEETGPMLTGTIRTETGEIPEFVEFFNLRALQELDERKHGYARILPDGSYTMELTGFLPGTFIVYIHCRKPDLVAEGQERMHTSPMTSYVGQSVKSLGLPENAEFLEHDFVLEEASYFYGKVLDQNLQPVPEAFVSLYDATAPSYGEAPGNRGAIGYRTIERTDANGVFLLDGIRSNLDYKLEVYQRPPRTEAETPLAKLDGLKPPIDNIVIRLNLEESSQ